MTLAEEWARYSFALAFSDLPEGVVHQAKRALIDTLGCGIGGYTSEAVFH